MSRVLVSVPTLDSVSASFHASQIRLRWDDGNKYGYSVKCNSLTYYARNEFAFDAINGKYDYLVCIDSDMLLEPDTVIRLVADIESSGADLVTGIYFKRMMPTAPVIYRKIDWYEDEVLGAQEEVEAYEGYPEDGGLFEIDGCGMGCCVIRVGVLTELVTRYRMAPFTPMPRLSEDLSFCWHMKQIGKRMLADPEILPGHAGLYVYRKGDWEGGTRNEE